MKMAPYIKVFTLGMLVSILFIACEKKEVSLSKQELDSEQFSEETLPIGKVNDVTFTIQQDAGDTSENGRLQIIIQRNKVQPDVSDKVKQQLKIDLKSAN